MNFFRRMLPGKHEREGKCLNVDILANVRYSKTVLIVKIYIKAWHTHRKILKSMCMQKMSCCSCA